MDKIAVFVEQSAVEEAAEEVPASAEEVAAPVMEVATRIGYFHYLAAKPGADDTACELKDGDGTRSRLKRVRNISVARESALGRRRFVSRGNPRPLTKSLCFVFVA